MPPLAAVAALLVAAAAALPAVLLVAALVALLARPAPEALVWGLEAVVRLVLIACGGCAALAVFAAFVLQTFHLTLIAAA